MKNILQIRSEFRDNGPATQSLEIAQEMKRRGYNVIFASSGGILTNEISKEFKHITIPTLAVSKRSIVATLKNISELRRIIREEAIDVIHGHNAAATYCAYLASIGSGRNVKITDSVHGMEIRKGYGWRNWIYLLCPATFFAVSGFTRDMLLKVGVRPERIITIYVGVDAQLFDKTQHNGEKIRRELGVSEDTLLIGQVGAFAKTTSAGKGQQILVKAVSILKKNGYRFHAVIVGDGPTKEYCMKLAEDLGVSDIVHFLGFRRDIPDIQAALDICVLASIAGEMFPASLLEGMAMGNPWVASRLSGIPEMAEDGRAGLLAEPGNAEDLAAKLELLLRDSALRTEMGNYCYKCFHEKYTMKAICDKIEPIYES